MKALIYDGVSKICLGNWGKPILRPDDCGLCIVKVKNCGICGTDISVWQGGFPRVNAPTVLGHEFWGEVVEISNDSSPSIHIGDFVTAEASISCGICGSCRRGEYNVCENLKVLGVDVGYDGGFAEYVKVDVRRLHKVPSQIPAERVALCEPLSVGIHVTRRVHECLGNEILILGSGPIGLLIAIAARHAGASRIVMTDINPYRLDLAQQFGFHAINMNESSEDELASYFTCGKADVVYEVVGSEETYRQAIRMARMGGTVLCAGVGHKPIAVDMNLVTLKELHLLGSRLALYDDFETALELLADEKIPFEKLISKILPFDRIISEGFEAIRDRDPVMKILASFD